MLQQHGVAALLGSSNCVGLDAEWTPNTPLSVIQIAAKCDSGSEYDFAAVVLTRVLSQHGTISVPPCIASILKRVDVVKTGVGIAEDLSRIYQHMPGMAPAISAWCDVRSLVPADSRISGSSLAALTQFFCSDDL